ncbi:MAG: IS5/IS1182 family transposase, partial [Magnetococcus sp. WYHC-3]
GDKANALLVGIGYNLRAILRKLRLLFAWFLTALAMALGSEARPKNLAAA